MFKGVWLIQQPAPNTACSGWWGVAAFFGICLALGFFRFDGESALRPTTTNAHRWAVNMSKKHYLPILASLLVVSSIIYFGIETYRIVAVCKDTLAPSDSPFRGDFEYKRIDFLPGHGYRPITVLFDFRGDTAFCHVHRSGSEWKVDKAGLFGIAPLP